MASLKSSSRKKSTKRSGARSSVAASSNVSSISAAPKVVASVPPVAETSAGIDTTKDQDMVVRKGELAERVAAKADVKKRDAKAISEATIDVLIEALSNGEIIVLPAAKISMQRKKDLEKGSVIIAKFRVKEQTPKFDSDFNLDDDSEGDDA